MIKKINEEIYFIPGEDEFLPDSHVYVIGNLKDHDFTLVDAGLIRKGFHKLRALEEMNIPLTAVKRIILTHTHFDHIGCFAELKRFLTNLELWLHEDEGNLLKIGDERPVYGMVAFRELCQSQYALKDGDFSFSPDRMLKDGDKFVLGSDSWSVVHVPGHSPGSIALYNERKKVLISGDIIYADHAIGRFDLFGANAAQLKNSLIRLSELDVQILLPGHNRIITDLKKGYLKDTLDQWSPYLR